jgi:serine protease Do
MWTTVVTLALLQQAPTAEIVPTPEQPPSRAAVETLHLGEDRSVRGRILKETDTAIWIDVGYDVLHVPIAAIVRRESSAAADETAAERDEGLFRTARRPEKSVAEGSREVAPAVVKIESAGGQGSGFITSPDGYVVTNFHVVEDEVEVDVVLYIPGEKTLDTRTLRDVKVIAANPHIDLALLKIDPPEDLELPFVYLGDSEEIAVGDTVYAIGAPIGLDRTVSSGIVSVTNRSFGGHTMLQITTPINPGNSGGPLFDLRGEVVGVNSAGYMGMQGLNFAIPSKYVKDFLRNRDAFAVDTTRSEHGIHYLPAPRKPELPGDDH